MRLRRSFLAGFALFWLLAGNAFALTPKEQQSVANLRVLYATALQNGIDTQAEMPAPIIAERARLRQIELDDVNALVAQLLPEEPDQPSTVDSALAKQQAVVATLEARRKETEVDRELINTEEDTLNESTELTDDQKLRDRADIFARAALLEERASALDEVLVIQRERLDGLAAQERGETFIDVLHVGSYALAMLIIIIGERVLRAALMVRIRDRNKRYLATKLLTGTVYLIVGGWVVYRIFADYPGILTSFAIVGAGIAVALQAVIKDIMGWLVIVHKRLYTLGQRVSIGHYTGDVADITLLRTTLVEVWNTEDPDVGRIGQSLHLPNSHVLEKPVLNYNTTSDFMEAQMVITVGFENDWRQAEKLITQVLQEIVGPFLDSARSQTMRRTQFFFQPREPQGPRVFLDIMADGIQFTLRFQVPIGQRRSIVSQVTRSILDRFAAASPPIGLRKID